MSCSAHHPDLSDDGFIVRQGFVHYERSLSWEQRSEQASVIPATFSWREAVETGGLMRYGANFADGYHQVGIYTGRILKGEKASDLPVMQASRFERVINSGRRACLASPCRLRR
jgi:hypothetical protein